MEFSRSGTLFVMNDHSTLPSVQHAYPGRPRLSEAALYARREGVFLLLAGLFLGTLAMLNILGITRFLKLFEIDFDGDPANGATAFAIAVGVLPYPLTFLCTDFISELYGKRRANLVVWVGLLLNLWVVFILWAGSAMPGFGPVDPATHMPAPPEWNAAKGVYVDNFGWTFFQVRNLAFGAVTASMVAYLAAQFIDVHVFHFWKNLTNNKHLWLRNNGSTLVSQLVDTVCVILITHFYAHALPVEAGQPLWPQLLVFIATGYVFKAVAALLDTAPFYVGVYAMTKYLRLPPPHVPMDLPPAGAAVEAGVG